MSTRDKSARPICLVLRDEQIDQLDELAETMRSRIENSARFNRSAAARLALARGLELLTGHDGGKAA